MWIARLRRGHRRRGVAVLVFTVVLTVISAMTAMFLSNTLMDHSRMNERRRELWRAFLHAESGIAQVQHWALNPADYAPDASLFAYDDTGFSPGTKYPGIQAQLDNGGLVVAETDLDNMGITGFTTDNGWSLGRIAQISILPLDGSEPASAAGSFFKVVSIGQASNGVQREVSGYARLTNTVNVEIPGPLMSMDSANAFGNAAIHWGEAWAKTDFNVLNKSQYDYALSDPFVVWRTEGQFSYPANWKVGTTSSNKDIYVNFMDQSATPIGRRPGLFDDGLGTWKDKFYQDVPVGVLSWPDFAGEYQTYKDLALANGRYYTTDANGNMLKDGQIVDFYSEFTVPDRANANMDLAFIDTTNAQPPDGTNLTTLQVSGSSAGLKGFLYINANLDVTGVGSPPSLTVNNPISNTDETLEKIFLDGMIYAAGTIAMGGNAGVYGAIVAEDGFVGGGTPDIYYNQDLADGMDLGDGNLGSPFKIVLHSNSAPVSP